MRLIHYKAALLLSLCFCTWLANAEDISGHPIIFGPAELGFFSEDGVPKSAIRLFGTERITSGECCVGQDVPF
jgi:hypothetical protein